MTSAAAQNCGDGFVCVSGAMYAFPSLHKVEASVLQARTAHNLWQVGLKTANSASSMPTRADRAVMVA